MKVFSERKSGIFLKKFGFNIVNSFYVRKKSDLKNAVEKIGFPCVVKVFGENVIHKKKLGGVALGINNYESVLKFYNKFEKIKGFEGVVIQKEIVDKGNEFLVGLQKTPEFGHVVAFGVGGSDVEKLGKVGFRVCDFDKKEAMEFVNEFFRNLSIKKKKILVKILLKCCKLSKKFPSIKELDINPLVISQGKAIVLDSRIVWEDKNL
jgi:succinyl-CoA synthetase beta subunit